MKFRRVLVANRGEIALRIMRTCHALGLGTVGVYSDADADAPHVQFADRAVRIGGPAATESYLNIPNLIAAAQLSGADAIHPGYGFLAENAEFANAVESAGLVFIGPTADMITLMGDKGGARRLMSERGVPVTPGYSGDDQSEETFLSEAQKIGFPVLVKAVAGGGGKGMSIVEKPNEIKAALEGARRLAENAFGNGELLLEAYIPSPRHIEVQILGDGNGHVIHCFERECSIQRRFQKIIEEAPSASIDESTRAALCSAAVTAGLALNYRGAGTVEFIVAPDGTFYFLEVNTRLQVEHPVTEYITGLDLVAQQIRVAQGGTLPHQDDITCHGHAVECRLYAEDPENDFMPATGVLKRFNLPAAGHVRLDAGVETGTEVGIHYDPMLAKLITWGEDRDEATNRLVRALKTLTVIGVRTNRAYLIDILDHEVYRRGVLSTHFIAEHMKGWSSSSDAAGQPRRLLAAIISQANKRAAAENPVPTLRPRWRLFSRSNRIADQWTSLEGGYEVAVRYDSIAEQQYRVRLDSDEWMVQVVSVDADTLTLVITHPTDDTSMRQSFVVVADGETTHVQDDETIESFTEASRFPIGEASDVDQGCIAPMPGRVVAVHVAVGDDIDEGQSLVILEAMKMEQNLVAGRAGTVQAVHCAEGDIVEAGTLLVDVEVAEQDES